MPYTRRRTWPERPDRQDYEICCDGLRVYPIHVPEGDRWLSTIYMNGHVPKVESVPISGLAVTLDKATSQFR